MLRRLFTIVPLALVVASAFMLFLINLSGLESTLSFLNKFYFSSVTTTEETRWYNYALCYPSEDQLLCSGKVPAYPFSPADNFGASIVPEAFVLNRNTYYYLLRIAYAWFLLALLFAILSLFPILWSCCWRGFISGFFASIIVGISLFFSILGALFETGVHALGVSVFKKAGYTAALGTNMMIIMWLTVAFMLIAWLWMFFVGIHGAEKVYDDSALEKSHGLY